MGTARIPLLFPEDPYPLEVDEGFIRYFGRSEEGLAIREIWFGERTLQGLVSAMFKEMRRQDRGLSQEATEEILTMGTYGILSMNGENDYGYGVPLSYVYMGGDIYLHCALEGQKLDRIRSDNKVTFCVVGEATPMPDIFAMKYTSAIAFGKAGEVDGEEKMKALIAFVKKYSTDEYLEKGRQYAENAFHKTVIIKIAVEHLTGKGSK
jgi:uncharacterized protein